MTTQEAEPLGTLSGRKHWYILQNKHNWYLALAGGFGPQSNEWCCDPFSAEHFDKPCADDLTVSVKEVFKCFVKVIAEWHLEEVAK